MKKSLLGLLCVSACALAGCGKSLSTEDACKFADEHWVTGEKAYKENVEYKDVSKVKKATGIFENAAKDSEKSGTTYCVASSSVSIYALGESGYKFSTFAGKLYADCELSKKDLIKALGVEVDEKYVDGSGSDHYVYNKEGFLIKHESKMEFSVEFKESIFNIVGEISVVETITYSI